MFTLTQMLVHTCIPSRDAMQTLYGSRCRGRSYTWGARMALKDTGSSMELILERREG
jgi:hypothetical protein